MRSIVVVGRSMQDRPFPSVLNKKRDRDYTPTWHRNADALISELFRAFQTQAQHFPRLSWISWDVSKRKDIA
jgi:hypothetical protein